MENKCEYCDEPITQTRIIYDFDMRCSREISVCDNCAEYIDLEDKYKFRR